MQIFKGNEFDLLRALLPTLSLVALYFISRAWLTRIVSKRKISAADKRTLIVNIRKGSLMILVASLLLLWGSELKTFALSVVAVAAAIAIATKDLISSFLGGVSNTLTKSFRLGDRIEIFSPSYIRGDVVSHDLLTTTLLEVGPDLAAHQFTGKTISLPNSVFLASPVRVEQKSAPYRLHTFNVFLINQEPPFKHLQILLKAAEAVCAPFREDAKAHFEYLEKKEGIIAPSVDARVFLAYQTDGVQLIVRVPVPSLRASRIEQAILREYTEKRDLDSN